MIEIALGVGILTLLFAILTALRVLKYERGTESMIKISEAVQEGASAFLKKEYKFLPLNVYFAAMSIFVIIGRWSLLAG